MPRHHLALDAPRSALLHRLVLRLTTAGRVTDDVRAAVDVLVASADSRRPDRMSVRPGEAPVLVERLAVWALARASNEAVAAAAGTLDGEGQRGRSAIASLV